MSHSSELERVRILASVFGPNASGGASGIAPGIATGIGDDAAVLERIAEPLVWTIDAQVEGTHFRLDWLTWADVGWRSFMAAASDLAAMGALPLGALSALVLADAVDDAALTALAEGQAAAARTIGTSVVGGNLARGRETSVTTTLLGSAPRAVLRSGAREGDGVFLAGAVGMAAAGLAVLERGLGGSVDLAPAACVDAWRRPNALVERGRAVREQVSAAVDVSDGLTRDVAHVAEASSVTIVLDERALRERLPPTLVRTAALLKRDALELALGGGEDYALCVTSALPRLDGFDRIGRVERGAAAVVLERVDGARAPITPRGFDHFARSPRR